MGKYFYNVGYGVMGWMPDVKKYQLFATEMEYSEAFDIANEPYKEIINLD